MKEHRREYVFVIVFCGGVRSLVCFFGNILLLCAIGDGSDTHECVRQGLA